MILQGNPHITAPILHLPFNPRFFKPIHKAGVLRRLRVILLDGCFKMAPANVMGLIFPGQKRGCGLNRCDWEWGALSDLTANLCKNQSLPRYDKVTSAHAQRVFFLSEEREYLYLWDNNVLAGRIDITHRTNRGPF